MSRFSSRSMFARSERGDQPPRRRLSFDKLGDDDSVEADEEPLIVQKPERNNNVTACPRYFDRTNDDSDDADDVSGGDNDRKPEDVKRKRPGLERADSIKGRFGGLQKSLSSRSFFGRSSKDVMAKPELCPSLKEHTEETEKGEKEEEAAKKPTYFKGDIGKEDESEDDDDQSIELIPKHLLGDTNEHPDHKQRRAGLKRTESARSRNRNMKCRRRDLLKSSSTRSANDRANNVNIQSASKSNAAVPQRRRSFDDLVKYKIDGEDSDGDNSIDILLPSQLASLGLKRTESVRRSRKAPGSNREGVERVDSRRKLVRRTNSRRSHLMKRDEFSESRRSVNSRSMSNGSLLSGSNSEELQLEVDEPNDHQPSEPRQPQIRRTNSRRNTLHKRNHQSDSRRPGVKRTDSQSSILIEGNDSFSSIISGLSDMQLEEFPLEEETPERRTPSAVAPITTTKAGEEPQETKKTNTRKEPTQPKESRRSHGRRRTHRRGNGSHKRRSDSSRHLANTKSRHQRQLSSSNHSLMDKLNDSRSSQLSDTTHDLTSDETPNENEQRGTSSKTQIRSLEECLIELPSIEPKYKNSLSLKPPPLNPPSLNPPSLDPPSMPSQHDEDEDNDSCMKIEEENPVRDDSSDEEEPTSQRRCNGCDDDAAASADGIPQFVPGGDFPISFVTFSNEKS